MPELYRSKIISAFRDNAIKSVLLIDDHYLPYEGMGQSYVKFNQELSQLILDVPANVPNTVEQLRDKLASISNIVDSATTELMSSETAGIFVDFFHSKKLICDVENQTHNLDKDKIRKSDLIVLDYHLKEKNEPNPAEHSLNLISDLSSSKHMNIVVVFTAEGLKDVWREVAATLRGTHTGNVDEYLNNEALLAQWNDFNDDWIADWELFYNTTIEADYLKSELNIEATIKEFKEECESHGHEIPEDEHIKWLLENSVAPFNKNMKPLSKIDVHGKKDLWLQSGDVFIVLCEKERAKDEGDGQRDTTPEEVWEQIKVALVNWYPSFYRVVTSELQNQIEDANLSMEKVLSKGNVAQVAELWGILRLPESDKKSAAQGLLKSLVDDVLGKLSRNSIVLDHVINTANSIADNIPEYICKNISVEGNKTFLRQVISLANRNITRTTEELNEQQQYEVAHAYNEQLSTIPHHLQYFTTGSVLKDEHGSWYLCVTPSCNTIPNQMTDRGIRDLAPHRQLTLAKLKKEPSIITALQSAHQSSHIFITDTNGDRLAFGVININTKLPDLLKVIVINHDSNQLENASKTVNFYKTKIHRETGEPEIKANTRKLTPMALLRPAYAARYQNIQSHYEGRIGVDFATLDLSIPDDTEH